LALYTPRLFFTLWRPEQPRIIAGAIGVHQRASGHSPPAVRRTGSMSTVADTLNVPRLWLSTMAPHVIVDMRSIIQLEPIASVPEDELIALVASRCRALHQHRIAGLATAS
jgi:hypothetical protein